MHRLGAGGFAGGDDLVDAEVASRAPPTRRCARPHRPSAHAAPRDRHRNRPRWCGCRCASRGLDDAAGDLAAIGDEEGGEHLATPPAPQARRSSHLPPSRGGPSRWERQRTSSARAMTRPIVHDVRRGIPLIDIVAAEAKDRRSRATIRSADRVRASLEIASSVVACVSPSTSMTSAARVTAMSHVVGCRSEPACASGTRRCEADGRCATSPARRSAEYDSQSCRASRCSSIATLAQIGLTPRRAGIAPCCDSPCLTAECCRAS